MSYDKAGKSDLLWAHGKAIAAADIFHAMRSRLVLTAGPNVEHVTNVDNLSNRSSIGGL